ncbi:hypothetical protein J2744_000695 [Halorubrum trapanicum]|uniref:Uncharacterized protein n=1 Tax=Halorubrum trapanicum TaxID=29284 RepID=A0A8J7R6U8_9EURY|nr:hypothetical protein [Halorubrum trapanicum]
MDDTERPIPDAAHSPLRNRDDATPPEVSH